MLIRGGFDITYDCSAPASAVLTLNVHPTRRADLQTPDTFTNDRGVAMPQYIDGFGNICTRVSPPVQRRSPAIF